MQEAWLGSLAIWDLMYGKWRKIRFVELFLKVFLLDQDGLEKEAHLVLRQLNLT
jgi:hypothetical protein